MTFYMSDYRREEARMALIEAGLSRELVYSMGDADLINACLALPDQSWLNMVEKPFDPSVTTLPQFQTRPVDFSVDVDRASPHHY